MVRGWSRERGRRGGRARVGENSGDQLCFQNDPISSHWPPWDEEPPCSLTLTVTEPGLAAEMDAMWLAHVTLSAVSSVSPLTMMLYERL